ncbi:T9SS type A sorting domain-containing protein [Xanthomarina gelatinilytica]|uniref:T9SS type A sorting domain-containing protein n=1 Tax=Xanthomarina gelatinilytica TaxID=1137281 RepID=UPI003AA8DD10
MKKITLLFFAVITFGFSFQANAQCDFDGNQYGSLVLANSGSVEQVSSCNFFGEYSDISNLTIGDEYQFDGDGGYVTLIDAADGSTVLVHGASPLNWVATVGAVESHWALDAACNPDSSCHITSVQNLDGTPPPPPTNIDCANATLMACGDTISATSVGSTGNQEGSGCSIGDNGIWFTFTGTGGDMTVESTASFDHEMAITSGACGSLVNIVCDDGSTGTETHTFTSSPGETYYVYIAHYASGSTTTGTVSITLTCAAIPTCFEVTNLDVTVLPGDTSATVSWDVEGSATLGYNWAVMNEFDDPELDAPVASGSTAAGVTTDLASGLTAGNDYDFYVQSNCDTNGLSAWAGPYNFNSTAPPANDTCASAEVAPVGLGSCGTSVTGHNVGATDSGVAQAGCATATYSGGDVWYTFDMPVGETELVYTRSASVFSTTQVELYSGTCGALVEEGCTTSATASFTGLTAGATYFLRLYDWGNNDFGSFTFCLNTPPTCPVPTGLGATNITTMSADLEWTDNAGASAWDIEWGTNGFTPSGTPNIEDTTNPHPLGGLSASSSYDFYVRADCGGGDTSTWAGPYTFVTADPPPACGENFYDTGGASGNYSANENYTITICPDVSGDAVTVTFNSFEVEGRSATLCWDNLFIYDGPDNTGTPITPASLGLGTGTAGFCWQGAGDGTADLTGQDITSTDPSGCLTFTFTSDGSGQYAGWDASVSCATIGTQEYNMNELFSYYPNPVNNTLSLRGVKDIQNVAVYNMLGQEVLRTAPNTVNSDVDMSGLQSGTYFVKVMIENTTKTIKVIKK